MKLKQELETLCNLDGISGYEDAVRAYIISRIDGRAVYTTDNLGNLIVFKKGAKAPENKLLLSAHMDEVGLIATYHNADGTVKIAAVGGVDARVLAGRRVRIANTQTVGVIGLRAVHNLTKEEKNKAPKAEELCVDFGCETAKEAEELCPQGTFLAFDTAYTTFGNGKITAKALDDRCGCAILLSLIDSELEYDTWFTFVVQEEIGLRGAKTAAFGVEPEYCMVLETTTAADIPSAEDEKRVCALGAGPVISYMDRTTIYNKKLYELAFATAREEEIPAQTKTMIAGGNDAGAIHLSKTGVKTIALSVPCRYLHSPSCVIAYADLKNTKRLVKGLMNRICSL